jgi:hypothetical protein
MLIIALCALADARLSFHLQQLTQPQAAHRSAADLEEPTAGKSHHKTLGPSWNVRRW